MKDLGLRASQREHVARLVDTPEFAVRPARQRVNVILVSETVSAEGARDRLGVLSAIGVYG